jgi:hypothetical protein
MPRPIDPDLIEAIKDRDARTDRYGEDAVHLVLHDLSDYDFIERHMDAKHQAICHWFRMQPEDERERIVRVVLNEPGPKVAEAVEELEGVLAREHAHPEKFASLGSSVDDLRNLIGQIEMVIPYVAATLARANGFEIEKMKGTFHGDPSEWLAVHGGRASSSAAQIQRLLGAAVLMKAKLST